jgi:hypothetical protein
MISGISAQRSPSHRHLDRRYHSVTFDDQSDAINLNALLRPALGEPGRSRLFSFGSEADVGVVAQKRTIQRTAVGGACVKTPEIARLPIPPWTLSF